MEKKLMPVQYYEVQYDVLNDYESWFEDSIEGL